MEIVVDDSRLLLEVTDTLREIGIPANVKGYHYIRESIIICVNDPSTLNSITKKLYPSVAERFETTPSRVERAMRHAIELTFERGNKAILSSYFSYITAGSKSRPTNSEFIAQISDKILVEYATA